MLSDSSSDMQSHFKIRLRRSPRRAATAWTRPEFAAAGIMKTAGKSPAPSTRAGRPISLLSTEEGRSLLFPFRNGGNVFPLLRRCRDFGGGACGDASGKNIAKPPRSRASIPRRLVFCRTVFSPVPLERPGVLFPPPEIRGGIAFSRRFVYSEVRTRVLSFLSLRPDTAIKTSE